MPESVSVNSRDLRFCKWLHLLLTVGKVSKRCNYLAKAAFAGKKCVQPSISDICQKRLANLTHRRILISVISQK